MSEDKEFDFNDYDDHKEFLAHKKASHKLFYACAIYRYPGPGTKESDTHYALCSRQAYPLEDGLKRIVSRSSKRFNYLSHQMVEKKGLFGWRTNYGYLLNNLPITHVDLEGV